MAIFLKALQENLTWEKRREALSNKEWFPFKDEPRETAAITEEGSDAWVDMKFCLSLKKKTVYIFVSVD